MASDEDSLQALENLMSEFFDEGTSNARKREIEDILNNFTQMKDSWKHCLYYMSSSRNEYVQMFTMTTIENLIHKQWVGLKGEDKIEIRNRVTQFLLEHHKYCPPYLRNKLVKLIVDIGRIDWPHFYPDFLSNILELAQRQDTAILAVLLLTTASEELASPRDDISMARKEELHRLLLAQVPEILNILGSILDSVLEKHRHMVAATPPPSPTQGERSSTRKSSLLLFSSSPSADSILNNMFRSPVNRAQLEALPPLSLDSKQLCSLSLQCLAQYFSWIPLSTTLTPSLLSTIFHFAGFGCEVKRGSSPSPSSYNSDTSSLGIQAMNCVNELLAKNCVPAEFEEFLLQMFQQTFHLLQKLTKDCSTNATGNKLCEIDENYVEKFTDFLRLFVSIHLRRFEDNTQFPVLEFLSLLLKYTFRQPTNEGFYSCLDTWNTFLDFIHNKIKDRSSDAGAIIARYQEALLSLVSHILQKFQFRYNQSQLEELDDEVLDDDSETEWQQFIRQCLEVVAKVAEIMTADTFRLLYDPFNEHLEVYLGIERFIASTSQGRQLTITAENECRRLHCALRDLSSFLQALGRLAEHFIGEKFPERFSDGLMLLTRLVHTVVYGTKLRLFEVASSVQNVLLADFIGVHAQSIASVKAFSHWLAQYYSESQRVTAEREKLMSMLSSLLNAVLPLLSNETPEKIVHSAAHFLLSVTTTIRPSFLLQLPCIQTVFNNASQGVYSSLSNDVQLLVYRSLSNCLILPWPNVPDGQQDWANRASHHQMFVKRLAEPFFLLRDPSAIASNKDLQDQAKPVIKKMLSIFEDWIEAISGEVVKSKQLCYQSLQEVVQVALAVFPVYLHQPDIVESLMGFFLALFQGLRVQMGVSFTEQTIQTFITMFSSDQLAENINHESTSAHRVIEKFLKILELIVQEPGSAFKAFLPNIMTICLDQIYPIIAQRASPDMKLVMYKLLHELLMNNWRYFFKGSVLTTLNNKIEEVIHSDKFIRIMETYGQSFMQPDIDVFRHNLESLQQLNNKWRLFQKAIFQEVMLYQFLNVLLQVLVHKSHDLLQEEIVAVVYSMAVVDFDKFFNQYLGQFLTMCEGIDDNQKSVLCVNFKVQKDLPSFTQNVQRFVNDLRYYRLVNSCLPQGSCKF